MSVLRYKYRKAPVQPELTNQKEKSSLSAAKKVKPVEEDPYADIPKVSHHQTIYLATHTQQKRVELFVTSDEEAYRRKQYPTIEERVAQQKQWASTQLKEAKMASERAAIKKMMDMKLRQAQKETDATNIDDGSTKEKVMAASTDDIVDELAKIPEDPNQHGPRGPQSSLEDLVEENAGLEDDAEEYLAELLDIKERKLTGTRNTTVYHREISKWERRRFAFRVACGLLGRRSREITEVTPWLLIGRKENATDLQLLLRLNITHILNVSSELPMAYPNHFIYQKIPVKDSIEADIAVHFSTIINFIKRVEDCEGRLLVHCTVGASRAPTAVIAYLVIVKRIPLVDAYGLIYALRPLMQPNRHFLYELAMLETQLGEGCSVFYHPDWRFYEFNLFRAERVEERDSVGSFKAASMLLQQTTAAEEDGDG